MQPRTLHHYMYINRPYDRVRLRLAQEMVTTIEQAAGQASQRARAVAASTALSTSIVGVDVAVPVHVEIHSFEQSDVDAEVPTCALHLSWRADRAAAVFPQMSAELIARQIGPDETQLAFYGSYKPPLGFIGRAADSMLLHRVAEACVQTFLEGVGRDIAADIAGGRGA